MNEFGGIFAISCVAVLAPLLVRLPALAFMPVVGLELILGVLIGPSVLGLVTNDNTVKFLAEFGLVFLFFQAGLESKRDEIGRAELRLGAFAWLVSFALAAGFVGVLYLFGLVRSPLLVALILPTTAFGVLIPILRQTGELHGNFGRHVLGLAAIGELGPLLLAAISLAEQKHQLHQAFLSIAFFALVFAAVIVLLTLRSNGFSAKLTRWLGQDAELLLLRISLLVLLGFVFLADSFGMEAVVGAYAAGMAVAVFFSGCGGRALESRLTSIGSGFFIPLFFTASGVAFDLPALVSHPANIGRLLLFTLAFLLIRIPPLGIYKNALAKSDLPALALLSSTTLPLVVAITYLGGKTGQ
ncbi:MAG: cation:proton antiporter, partial [Candidatus Korobacteraceae bacterium]